MRKATKSPAALAHAASAAMAAASSLWLVPPAAAQDSVASTPGGNDALAPYTGLFQRKRFVVDLAPATTSWGASIGVAPILKSSRDTSPVYNTLLLGAVALSPQHAGPASFEERLFEVWTTAGQGVSQIDNDPAGTIAIDSFDRTFGAGLTDISDGPTNIVSALVGVHDDEPSRLYVERVIALSSRNFAGVADSATLTLGAVDPLGRSLSRADGFNAGAGAVIGDSIVMVDGTARAPSVNTLDPMGASNVADDAAATTFLRNAAPFLSPPTATFQSAPGPQTTAVTLDFSNDLSTVAAGGSVVSTSAHLGADVAHRAAPTFSPDPSGVGPLGVCAALARVDGGPCDTIAWWSLNAGAPPAPATYDAGSRGRASLPSPISGPGGFSANAAPGDATFIHYESQWSVRGGAGPVGVGRTSGGDLVVAATARDVALGEFIAVATITGSTESWDVAARAGQPVLDGPAGAAVGALIPGAPAAISAPAVDNDGSVYFVSRWQPTSGPGAGSAQTGLFRAARGGSGEFEIERILTTGQTVLGENSATPWLLTSLTLADQDSLASGAFHGGSILQQAAPGSGAPIGGIIVAATIDYLRPSAIVEAYDVLLFIAPAGGAPCPGDTNGDLQVDFIDLNIVLGQFNETGPGLQGDVDGDEDVDFGDLNIVLGEFNNVCR